MNNWLKQVASVVSKVISKKTKLFIFLQFICFDVYIGYKQTKKTSYSCILIFSPATFSQVAVKDCPAPTMDQ